MKAPAQQAAAIESAKPDLQKVGSYLQECISARPAVATDKAREILNRVDDYLRDALNEVTAV